MKSETKVGALRSEPELPGGCSLWQFPKFSDPQGDLTVADLEANLPFPAKRIFFVYNVPNDAVRGEHAHRECNQIILAIKGAATVIIDDGKAAKNVVLADPSIGLFIPPRVWTKLCRFSSDAVLAVLASHPYQPEDYIDDYSEFVRIVAQPV